MNFQGFSPDCFEQFIRALALKIIGPGVTIFGNGPDGGREATFQGKVNYPFPPTDIWDGYGVIQAKFKERIEDTQRDQQWAERQLERELSLWEKSDKRNPKPDYFIYCTNVELTSASNGGRAAVECVFEKHKAKLGLKGHFIWDANQLLGYVDGQEEIRKRFKYFFTSGDLLDEMAKALTRTPSPDAILTTYLARTFLADEDARLSQSGDRSEDRIKLANVFVDLPVGTKPSTEPPSEAGSKLPPAALHLLMHAASVKLDPLALYEQKEKNPQSPKIQGRFVFLGGPGSGKSTIGQFLAQINRAAILERRPNYRLEQNVRNIIADLKCRCDEESAKWPTTPRYPFRVELNAFAKALSRDSEKSTAETSTLSEYLRRDLSPNVLLGHDDFREWLKLFPSLLILDGLDEVPASSNRREVVAAIQSFLSEARDLEADLMIVASSRLDGYAGEFDGDEVLQLYLLPLSKPRALVCAQRYVAAKVTWKNDQRAKESMAVLKNAIENPLVAKLMVTPLQVTFMVTVVAASGKPSESRWQLFDDYYRIIYERELHKAVLPFVQVLNERRQDIDTLHHKVGFILQCRGESSGGTQADMALDEFEALVTRCLEENGLSPDEINKQKEMLVDAAKLRLVFITSRTKGRLSFDVRSLQEYMAAACLTNADSDLIIKRLDVIAHSPYWRNTFLFAIGRFFAEPRMRDHRDKVRLLCEDLNLNLKDRTAVKLGSRIALEVLESGTTGNVPLINRSLVKCALELLATAPEQNDVNLSQRLAKIYNLSQETEFASAIKVWIGQKEFTLALSAWLLLLLLEENGVAWASKLASEMWPCQTTERMQLLSLFWTANVYSGVFYFEKTSMQRTKELIARIEPDEYDNHFAHVTIPDEVPGASWLSTLSQWWHEDETIETQLFNADVPLGLRLRFNCISDNTCSTTLAKLKAIMMEPEANVAWKHFLLILEYLDAPSAISLATALEYIANTIDRTGWKKLAYFLPWPAACCVESALSAEELLAFAKDARAGKIGDQQLWTEKERHWKENGITIEELSQPIFQCEAILATGVKGASSSDASIEDAVNSTRALFKMFLSCSNKNARSSIAWVFGFYCRHHGTLHCIDGALARTELLPSHVSWSSNDFCIDQSQLDSHRDIWIEFFDALGKMQNVVCANVSWRVDKYSPRWLFEAFTADNSKTGLLRLLGFWHAVGLDCGEKPLILPQIEAFSDPKSKLAIVLIQMTRRDLTNAEASSLAEMVPELIGNDSEPQCLDLIVTCIERHSKDVAALEILLEKVTDLIPLDEWSILARVQTARNVLLQRRTSGLDHQVLHGLRLPLVESSGIIGESKP